MEDEVETLKSLVILQTTAAICSRHGSPQYFPTRFDAGMRFEAVAVTRVFEENLLFHDLDAGLWFMCPAAAAFELSGRFSGRQSV